VPDSAAPPWIDDLFPVPTPPALRTLLDIAWQHTYDLYLERESYDYLALLTHYDFMFDLDVIPRPLEGWHGYAEFDDDVRRPTIPLSATPEFVSFGALGTGAYVGWLVPAPELERADHPVALAGGEDGGVTWIGADTYGGLEFMLSWTLRRWREMPEPPGEWHAEDQRLLDRLATALGIHPHPDRTYAGSSWDGAVVFRDDEFDLVFDVPEGWRHTSGADGIGVLAPSDAFADRDPVAGDVDLPPESLGRVLGEAARALDAGHPASALLGLKDAFFHSPVCYFADLKPLWSRAYRDLGRPRFAERLELMASTYQALSHYCRNPRQHGEH
jgi:hypothetical protein